MKLSDQEILHAIKSGGLRMHEIMDYVYLKSRSKIIGYVIKNGGNKEDGKDVLQDSVAAFYSNIINNKFRGESDIEGYLFGIARNTWMKYLKKRGKAKALQDASFRNEEPSEFNLNEDYVERLDSVLEKIDNVCRDLLVHAFYYNYSASELCKKFDFKNEQVARNKKYKCLKKLKVMMEKFKNV